MRRSDGLSRITSRGRQNLRWRTRPGNWVSAGRRCTGLSISTSQPALSKRSNQRLWAEEVCSRRVIRRLSNFQAVEYRRFRLRRLCPSNGAEQGNVQRFVPACLAPDFRCLPASQSPRAIRRQSFPAYTITRCRGHASVSQKSRTRFTQSWSASLKLTAREKIGFTRLEGSKDSAIFIHGGRPRAAGGELT